jgi:hypothetical protein
MIKMHGMYVKKMKELNCSLEGVWPNHFFSGEKKRGNHIYCTEINERTKSGQEPETRVRKMEVCMEDRCVRAVCGRSLVGVVGSNRAGGNGCLSLVSVVCCTGNGLCDGTFHQPDESYRI